MNQPYQAQMILDKIGSSSFCFELSTGIGDEVNNNVSTHVHQEVCQTQYFTKHISWFFGRHEDISLADCNSSAEFHDTVLYLFSLLSSQQNYVTLSGTQMFCIFSTIFEWRVRICNFLEYNKRTSCKQIEKTHQTPWKPQNHNG